MKPSVIILFEQSGIVREAFHRRGFHAVSVDLELSAIPGEHIQTDVFDIPSSWIETFDLVIAHPPCTCIAVSGNRYYANTPLRQQAADDIEAIWNLPNKYLVIENPVGQINKYLPYMPRPQYIQPYDFGHDASKKTGLWKRNLPDLKATYHIPPMHNGRYANQTPSGQNNLPPGPDRARLRAETYFGIAAAMAYQWGNFIKEELNR